jgi:ribosome-interacting GTPase 1
MPMPARDLWSRIQKQLQGRPEDEQLRILRRHLDELRDRLRRLAARLETHEAVRSRGGQADPFHVRRQGDARVVVCGLPNAGKSTLVAALTGAATTVADYPFATEHPVPGMLPCPDGALQLLDTPPVVAGLAAGQGAGRALLHVLAQADVLLLTVDLTADPVAHVDTVLNELAEACVLPLAGPVPTVLRPRGKGGVHFAGPPLTRAQEDDARQVLEAAHIPHAEVQVRTRFDADLLQRQVDGDTPLPVVIAGMRGDDDGAEVGLELLAAHRPDLPCLRLDGKRPVSMEVVVPALLQALGAISVGILDRPREDADPQPALVTLGSDVGQVAERAGVPAARLKGARIWGDSVPRPGQTVGVDHIVAAGDRVWLHS